MPNCTVNRAIARDIMKIARLAFWIWFQIWYRLEWDRFHDSLNKQKKKTNLRYNICVCLRWNEAYLTDESQFSDLNSAHSHRSMHYIFTLTFCQMCGHIHKINKMCVFECESTVMVCVGNRSAYALFGANVNMTDLFIDFWIKPFYRENQIHITNSKLNEIK